MPSKVCFKCGAEKNLEEFYRHKMMADGHLNKCKECTKSDVRANYRARPEKYAAYERERNQRPERRGRYGEYRRRRAAKSPEKFRARNAVKRAVREGRLSRQPCVHCGATDNIEAHHHDYSKPLDVIWCCFRCHREIEHGQTVHTDVVAGAT